MVSFEEIFSKLFGTNTLEEYALALMILIASVTILWVFRLVAVKSLKRFAQRTKTELDDTIVQAIESIQTYFYFLIGIFIALHFLTVAEIIRTIILYMIIINGVYYIIKLLESLVDYGIKSIAKQKKEEEGDEHTASILITVGKAVKVSIWILAVLLLLSNLGYNISTLIAGFGIGGIAIAFAMQNVLADVFSSISIYFDKPFKVGDFIVVGNDMGTVKKIGIKSTRIQTLQGEELVMSNRELTETRVRNFRHMERRRITFAFGVTYDTKTEKLKKIPKIIEEITGSIEVVELFRVHFKEFGDSSLNFEVVYYVNDKDYNVYMDTQQKINLSIKERFEKEGIEMAFPTRTIYMHNVK
jgi:small-conductance mechanosensitive channel